MTYFDVRSRSSQFSRVGYDPDTMELRLGKDDLESSYARVPHFKVTGLMFGPKAFDEFFAVHIASDHVRTSVEVVSIGTGTQDQPAISAEFESPVHESFR